MYFIPKGLGSHERSVQEKMLKLTDQLLRSTRKLVLILDIDHTLLHTTKNAHAEIAFKSADVSEDIFFFSMDTPLSHSENTYYVKLRPGLMKFLKKLSCFYFLVLYTKGLRIYAQKILSIIDPVDTLFEQRVVCREDQPNINDLKTINTLFPCSEKSVLIVDDRANIWQNQRNVYQCHKFHFWPVDHATDEDPEDLILDEYIGKQNEMLSFCEKPLDEKFSVELLSLRNSDNVLLTVLNVLLAVHVLYYKAMPKISPNVPQDAREILSLLKSKVFEGVSIVFSGVFPVKTNPKEQYIWRLAESFGAHCSEKITEGVTHLVARKLNTEKVNLATELKDVKIVSCAWLFNCITHFLKTEENRFLLGGKKCLIYVDPFAKKIIKKKKLLKPFLEQPSLVTCKKNVKNNTHPHNKKQTNRFNSPPYTKSEVKIKKTDQKQPQKTGFGQNPKKEEFWNKYKGKESKNFKISSGNGSEPKCKVKSTESTEVQFKERQKVGAGEGINAKRELILQRPRIDRAESEVISSFGNTQILRPSTLKSLIAKKKFQNDKNVKNIKNGKNGKNDKNDKNGSGKIVGKIKFKAKADKDKNKHKKLVFFGSSSKSKTKHSRNPLNKENVSAKSKTTQKRSAKSAFPKFVVPKLPRTRKEPSEPPTNKHLENRNHPKNPKKSIKESFTVPKLPRTRQRPLETPPMTQIQNENGGTNFRFNNVQRAEQHPKVQEPNNFEGDRVVYTRTTKHIFKTRPQFNLYPFFGNFGDFICPMPENQWPNRPRDPRIRTVGPKSRGIPALSNPLTRPFIENPFLPQTLDPKFTENQRNENPFSKKPKPKSNYVTTQHEQSGVNRKKNTSLKTKPKIPFKPNLHSKVTFKPNSSKENQTLIHNQNQNQNSKIKIKKRKKNEGEIGFDGLLSTHISESKNEPKIKKNTEFNRERDRGKQTTNDGDIEEGEFIEPNK